MCQHGKRRYLSIRTTIFMLMSFISIFVGSIQEDEFSKQITGAGDIKRYTSQREIFSKQRIGI